MKEQTEQIDLLVKALIKFKLECPELGLNSEVEVITKSGGKYKFKYADLSYLKKVCDPILAKNGLVVSQLLIEGGKLLTMLAHESGQYINSITDIGNVNGKSAQEIGSLITYFKRYSYSALLGISADADDDANTADGNTSKQVVKPALVIGSENFNKCREAYLKDKKYLPKIMAKYEVSNEVHFALTAE
jgi:hypothetical protein